MIHDLGPAGRCVVSSGNSVPDFASLENVREMLDAVREFGEYLIVASAWGGRRADYANGPGRGTLEQAPRPPAQRGVFPCRR